MNKLLSNINQIKNDLILIESRDEFLARCTYERIRYKNYTYEKKFDQYLNLIEKSEISSDNLLRLSNSIKSLSKLTISSYEALISMLETYNNKFYK